MKQDAKGSLMLCVLLAIYIVISKLGVYSIGNMLLLPIVAIPLTLYMIKYNLELGTHVLYNMATLLAIYALTGQIESSLIYLISIAVPVYAVSYFYRKKYPLPNIIVYSGIISGIAFLLYYGVMKGMGVNYELQYMNYTEHIKTAIVPAVVSRLMTTSGIVDKRFEVQITQLLIGNLDLMKQLFAAVSIINAFICSIIQVLIIHLILRLRDKTLPGLGQLLEFRISRVLLGILAGAIFLMTVTTDALSGTMILGVNVVVIIYMLLMLVGLLSVIGIIKKSSINKGVKIITGIFLGSIILFSPTLLILFGFLDTMFNFRKVTIVV